MLTGCTLQLSAQPKTWATELAKLDEEDQLAMMHNLSIDDILAAGDSNRNKNKEEEEEDDEEEKNRNDAEMERASSVVPLANLL